MSFQNPTHKWYFIIEDERYPSKKKNRYPSWKESTKNRKQWMKKDWDYKRLRHYDGWEIIF